MISKAYLVPAVGFVCVAGVVTTTLSYWIISYLPGSSTLDMLPSGFPFSIWEIAYYFGEVFPAFGLSWVAAIASRRWAESDRLQWRGSFFGVIEVVAFFGAVSIVLPIVAIFSAGIGDHLGVAIKESLVGPFPIVFYGAILAAPLLLEALRGRAELS